MRMRNYDWAGRFRETYQSGLKRYQAEERNPNRLFDRQESDFLESIGCTRQELFDFIDDGASYGEPDFETALLTAAVRREYFLTEQKGVASPKRVAMESLPAKTAAVEGIVWLPRLLAKARAKLRGEMPDDLMYGCGGDRAFFQEWDICMAEFLRLVWRFDSRDEPVIEWVKARRAQSR